MMKVLALDLGSTTGWETSWFTFEQMLPVQRGVVDWKGSHGERFMHFCSWLDELVFRESYVNAESQPDEVWIAYEEVKRWSSSSAAHVYGGFRGVVHALVAWAAKDPHPVVRLMPLSPTEIKHFATGSGSSDKVEMLKAAETRLHLVRPAKLRESALYDLADAAWIGELARYRIRMTSEALRIASPPAEEALP